MYIYVYIYIYTCIYTYPIYTLYIYIYIYIYPIRWVPRGALEHGGLTRPLAAPARFHAALAAPAGGHPQGPCGPKMCDDET